MDGQNWCGHLYNRCRLVAWLRGLVLVALLRDTLNDRFFVNREPYQLRIKTSSLEYGVTMAIHLKNFATVFDLRSVNSSSSVKPFVCRQTVSEYRSV